jgi:hypothetical protein
MPRQRWSAQAQADPHEVGGLAFFSVAPEVTANIDIARRVSR